MPEETAPRQVVLVVDDHPVFRAGLVALLSAQHWIERVVEADSCATALDAMAQEQPSLAVLDLGLPDGDGIDLTTRVRALVPGCRVLILTMTSSGDTARGALAAGASGYLVKETDPETIVSSLHTVANGGLVLGPHLDVSAVLAEEGRRPPAPFHRLSPREVQVVRLVAAGLTNAAVAARLALAEKTVRNQVSVILDKTGATDRVHLALLAREAGLVNP